MPSQQPLQRQPGCGGYSLADAKLGWSSTGTHAGSIHHVAHVGPSPGQVQWPQMPQMPTVSAAIQQQQQQTATAAVHGVAVPLAQQQQQQGVAQRQGSYAWAGQRALTAGSAAAPLRIVARPA